MEVEYQTLDHFKTISHHYKPYKLPSSSSTQPTFEFKVIYIRFLLTSNHQTLTLTINFPPRDNLNNTCLQINGIKIHPNETPSRPLNQHREDAFEYVNTDRIKFKGESLPFEVQTQGGSEVVMVCGVLRRRDEMWVMECREGEGVKEFNGGGSVEASFAGRSLGKALLLNGFVEFQECGGESCSDDHTSSKELEAKSDKEIEKEMNEEHGLNLNAEEEEMLVEEGELTWFNSGVKIGIGLGVGMSLGVGVGLGLIIRTYKSTSSVLKKLMV